MAIKRERYKKATRSRSSTREIDFTPSTISTCQPVTLVNRARSPTPNSMPTNRSPPRLGSPHRFAEYRASDFSSPNFLANRTIERHPPVSPLFPRYLRDISPPLEYSPPPTRQQQRNAKLNNNRQQPRVSSFNRSPRESRFRLIIFLFPSSSFLYLGVI